MCSDIVYISGPHDIRGMGCADIAWEEFRLFQPLLGQDAQMAGFATAARMDGIEVRVLAAPEIYCKGVALDRLQRHGGRVLAHVRFGCPRLPRILKHSANLVVLAENTTIPTKLGRHPFAAGAALPACVKAVLVYDRTTPLPDRVGLGTVPSMVLPPSIADADLLADLRKMPQAAGDGIILQSSAAYSETAWCRSAPSKLSREWAEVVAQRAAVLLPWNLAAPGSLVPDVLAKASFLAAQDRLPLTIVVLPYNDVPGSLAVMREVVAACTEHLAQRADSPAILWARAGSIDESFALLQMCRRAWIDTMDPEWQWMQRRLTTACGLPVNFISGPPKEIGTHNDSGLFDADELVTRYSHGSSGPLFWRTRVLSLRRLATLAEAIERGADAPFRPMPSKLSGPSNEHTPQNLRRFLDAGTNE